MSKLKPSAYINDEGQDARYAQHAEKRIEFVDQLFPKNGVGVELGVFKGHFSRVLLDVATPQEFHMMDPWYLARVSWPWAKGEQCTVTALINVLNHFKPAISNGVVKVHVGFDLELLEQFPDHYFDWSYIDSTHAYEQTRKELEILSRKMKPSGVLAGDDWVSDPEKKHYGVFRAVNEFVAETDWNFLVDGEIRQWALAGPDYSA